MKNLLFLIPLVGFSCGSEEQLPYQIPDNHRELIAGVSEKSWKHARRFNNGTRMNMDGCFLKYEQAFDRQGGVADNLSKHSGCGESLIGEWKVVKDQNGHYYIRIESDQIPDLMNIEDDFKRFKILQLSEEQMTLTYTHRQFSNTLTTFVDVMVPVGTEVVDRDFHW